MNGERSKPAHEPKAGELITARVGIMTRTLRFLAAPKARVAAKLVADFAEDLTPPEEREKTAGAEYAASRLSREGRGPPDEARAACAGGSGGNRGLKPSK
ncbi:MAG: hypothetical protein WDN28_31935 [Chthoniobacter sp.]